MKHTKRIKKFVSVGLLICMAAGIFSNIPAAVRAEDADTVIAISNGDFEGGSFLSPLKNWSDQKAGMERIPNTVSRWSESLPGLLLPIFKALR